MNILSEEAILRNSNIETSEIEQDIIDTKNEIEQYKRELGVFCRRKESRLQIYLTEGRIKQREDLLSALQQIIEYRNK